MVFILYTQYNFYHVHMISHSQHNLTSNKLDPYGLDNYSYEQLCCKALHYYRQYKQFLSQG